jgi:protein-disulfide isomerase
MSNGFIYYEISSYWDGLIMSTKERLERELEQLKKTYKTGIIKTDEYERARKKIDAKLAEQIKLTKKDDESKQIISDILDGKEEKYEADSKVGLAAVSEGTYPKADKVPEPKHPVDYGAYDEYYLNDKDNDEANEKEPENKEEYDKEKVSIAAVKDIIREPEKEEDIEKQEEDIKKEEDIKEEKETNKELGKPKAEKEEMKKDNETKKEGKKDKNKDKETKKDEKRAPEKKKDEKAREKHKAEKQGIKNDKKTKKEDEETDDKSTGARYLYISIILVIAISAVIFALMVAKDSTPDIELQIEKNLTNATGAANIDFYYSYSCKQCYRTFITLESIKATYGDYVKVNYRHFPLDLESDAIMDNAAECAKSQGAFIEYSKKLFAAKKPVTAESAILLFEDFKVNGTAEFKDCVNSKAKIKSVAAEYKASLASTIDNLPSIIINGSIITGEKPLSVYETIIDDQIGLR